MSEQEKKEAEVRNAFGATSGIVKTVDNDGNTKIEVNRDEVKKDDMKPEKILEQAAKRDEDKRIAGSRLGVSKPAEDSKEEAKTTTGARSTLSSRIGVGMQSRVQRTQNLSAKGQELKERKAELEAKKNTRATGVGAKTTTSGTMSSRATATGRVSARPGVGSTATATTTRQSLV
jgi:CRISPR/Cas system-associated endonuclease/helicase Cas3